MSAAPVRFRLATAAERVGMFGVVRAPITPVPVSTVPHGMTPHEEGERELVDGGLRSRPGKNALGSATQSRRRVHKEVTTTR